MVGRASPGQVRWASPGGKPVGQALGKPFDWLWGSGRPVRSAWQPDSVSGGVCFGYKGVGFEQKGFKQTTLYIRDEVISVTFISIACMLPARHCSGSAALSAPRKGWAGWPIAIASAGAAILQLPRPPQLLWGERLAADTTLSPEEDLVPTHTPCTGR